MKKYKILIADNDENIVSALQAELINKGFEIITAYDGAEALKKIKSELPDLVVLDILMPKIDGYRLCHYLREDPQFAELPIITLSGMAIEDEDRLKKIKSNLFLAKTRFEELTVKLLFAINSLLEKTPQQEELSKLSESSLQYLQARQMVRELLYDRLHMEEILNSMGDGVLEIDENSQVFFANPAALKLLNSKENELIGHKLPLCFEQPQQIEDSLKHAVAKKSKTVLSLDNDNNNFKIHLAPLFSNEIYQGAIILIEDITDEIRYTKEIEQRNRELEILKEELERRLKALTFFYELAQELTSTYKHDQITDTLLRSLAKIFKFDVVLLITDSDKIIHLKIESDNVLTPEILNHIKENIMLKYSEISGQIIEEKILDLNVKIGEMPTPALSLKYLKELDVSLYSDGQLAGLISLLRFTGDAFSDDDSKILNILANQTAETISRVQQVIESQKRIFESILSSMVDGVIMLDKKNDIIVMNNAARKMLRIPKSETHITADYLQDRLGFYPYHHLFGVEKKIPGEPIMTEILRIYDKTYHSIISPVFSSSNESIGTVIVLRDITAQKEVEEKKEEFLSVVSHELRTPLTSISGALDMVSREIVGKLTDKQKRYLDLAVDNCNRLHLIIDDLLDLSKFEKGKMEMTKELISLPALMKSSINRFEPLFQKKNISTEFKTVTDTPPFEADPNRIAQVMNNLLSNAIKFTPENGSIIVEIFQPKVFPTYVAVSVKDSGPGIKKEDLEKIFEKFETLKYTDERAVGGTGLGLAVCRSIIEAHGGKIWAESTYGHGATFIFTLPTNIKEISKTPFIDEAKMKERAVEKAVKGSNLVLVVEDEMSTAYALKSLLMENNYNVVLAENGQEAINKAREYHPDLITMDLKLPDIYGLQIMEILKHDPETRNIPILILSIIEEDEKMYHAGAAFYMKKPLEQQKFIEAVTLLSKPSPSLHKKTILIVDDDKNVRSICTESLSYIGYEVLEAEDAEATFKLLKRKIPDLILLDVMLPGIDGFELAEKLKSNINTSHIPIVFLTAKGQPKDKIKALKIGIEDYIIKPFDTLELGIRIEGILQRIEKELSASPTTYLPGGSAIEKEVIKRIAENSAYVLCYLDVDNLKSYNDVYGYAKADGVVKQTGDIIRDVVEKYPTEDIFAGHIAGDDFIVITGPERANEICIKIIQYFDKLIPLFYNREDQQKGFIVSEDRYGSIRQFPLMSLSIVSITSTFHRFTDYSQLSTLAAEYKKVAKAIAGSVYLRDNTKIYPKK